MEEKENKKDKKVLEKVKEHTEKLMEYILEQGIEAENIDFLDKIVDIHKDIANEEHWKKKEENDMRYRGYGNYSEYGNYGNYGDDSYGRRSRDSRGRYTERGRDSKYRGEDMLGEMSYHYRGYSEGREQYGRGNYNGKEESIKSLDYMLQSVVEFVQMLKQDASSQEEMELIKHYTKQISEM